MSGSYQRLVSLVRSSPRTVLEPSWVEDELLALRVLGGVEAMLSLYDSGIRYTNDSNSSVAYLIGITDEAPIGPAAKIAPGRVEPPDIDIDFEDRRRDEVKAYLHERWNHTVNISVYTKFSSRNLVRDVCRVFAVPTQDVNRVCMQFDEIDVFLRSDDTRWFRSKYPEIIPIVEKMEGRWRQYGMHAAGVVIANKRLTDLLPIESRLKGPGSDRTPCAAYDMEDCAKIGLIKMDILSLDTLTVLHDCIDLIKETRGIEVSMDAIPLDDAEVFSELSKGHTVGVFQAEAAPLTKLMTRMGISSFNDIVLATSLVRPGALTTVGEEFIRRKNGSIDYDIHDALKDIVGETYGLFIFQEQIIEALVKVGGFSWPEADKVRKIIGKKQDPEMFKAYEDKWVGAASKVLGASRAKKLWSDFEKFSGYAFNKAHATAYSLLIYRCAWMKCHYPLEYMTALLRNETKKEKISTFCFECERLGIEVLPPDINKSQATFSLDRERMAIRWGLSNIKGVGATATEEVLSHQPYDSLEDFMARVSRRRCNSAVIDRLQRSGAMEPLGVPGTREEDELYDLLGIIKMNIEVSVPAVPISELNGGAHLVMGMVKEVKKFQERTRISLEDRSGVSTFYLDEGEVKEGTLIIALVVDGRISNFTDAIEYSNRKKNGHPLTPFEKVVLEGQVFAPAFERLKDHGVGSLGEPKSLVVPISVRQFRTKKGDLMARAVLFDGEAFADVVVFPREYRKVSAWLKPFVPICVKLISTKDGSPTVSDDGIIPASRLLAMKGLDDG